MILEAALALSFYTIPACRWLDTREPGCKPGYGSRCHQGEFVDQERRDYLVQGVAECPAPQRPVPFAQTLVATVTVIEPTGNGFLTLFDATQFDRPRVASIAFSAGRTSSSLVFVQLGQQVGHNPLDLIKPDLAIYARVDGSTHVVVDILGYMAE